MEAHPTPWVHEQVTPIAIAVVRRGNEVLVGVRPEDSPLAGFAEFPGGKCHPGEAPESAAVRECFEETGLHVQAVRRLCEVEHSYAHGRLYLTFIECEAVADAEPRGSFRWVAIPQLRHYRFPEANARVLAILQATGGG
ncbi:MAG: NUDIX domain-containing protein [Gemmatales bacterium]|nr:NUDIX domain-containing protein [Gemmatales bacterium]